MVQNSEFAGILPLATLSGFPKTRQPTKRPGAVSICHFVTEQGWRRRKAALPNNRWIDQLSRDKQQHSTGWSVEKIHQAWSFGGDATVLADYVLTMMMV